MALGDDGAFDGIGASRLGKSSISARFGLRPWPALESPGGRRQILDRTLLALCADSGIVGMRATSLGEYPRQGPTAHASADSGVVRLATSLAHLGTLWVR